MFEEISWALIMGLLPFCFSHFLTLKTPNTALTIQESLIINNTMGTEDSISNLKNIQRYLLSTEARWYWAIIVVVVGTIISMLLPESFPINVIRYGLGALFVLYMPGYAVIKSFYDRIEAVESHLLSIGISLSIVPLTGLILDFTRVGIELLPMTLVLVIVTTGLSTLAVIRKASKR